MGKNSNTTNNNSSQSGDYNERLKHLFESRPDIVDKSFNKPLDYSKLDYGLSG